MRNETETISDAEAIAAIRNGDKERYRELVDRHANHVFAAAWSRLGDRDLAEDAAQEAFLKGFQRLGMLRRPEKFGAWIVAGARNAAINLGVRRRNELKTRRLWSLERSGTQDGTTLDLDGKPTAETVREALAALPAIHRECLALFYLEAKSVAEASKLLGVSESTFKTRLHRARTALRTALESRLEESLEGLRPSARFSAAVMTALAAQKPAWPVFGAIAAGFGKLVPVAALNALPVLAMVPALLFHRWLGREELENFRDPNGFRAENQRRVNRKSFRDFAAFLAAAAVVSIVMTNMSFSALDANALKFKEEFYTYKTAFALLLRWIAVLMIPSLVMAARLAFLGRDRRSGATALSVFWMFAAFFVVGVLRWNPAWLSVALALLMMTNSMTIASMPIRMDGSLFLRASNGLLKEVDPSPTLEIPKSTDFNVEARFRFATFLARRNLAADWRTAADATRLHLADVTSWRYSVPFVWGDVSTVTLQRDGTVSAHLGATDRRDLNGLGDSAAIETVRLETTVARAVQTAWEAFAKRDFDRAEAALGQEAADSYLLKDPKKTTAARWRVWQLRFTAVIMAAQAVFIYRAFQPPKSGTDLHKQEVRAAVPAPKAMATPPRPPRFVRTAEKSSDGSGSIIIPATKKSGP